MVSVGGKLLTGVVWNQKTAHPPTPTLFTTQSRYWGDEVHAELRLWSHIAHLAFFSREAQHIKLLRLLPVA